MTRRLAKVTLVVREYDEAIRFYVDKLGFELTEDTALGAGKRWVTVAPARGATCELLLAKAVTAEQQRRIGDQTGGRVFLFLEIDDLHREVERLRAAGVVIARPPLEQPYGAVAVVEDLYGNRIDLIQPRAR